MNTVKGLSLQWILNACSSTISEELWLPIIAHVVKVIRALITIMEGAMKLKFVLFCSS